MDAENDDALFERLAEGVDLSDEGERRQLYHHCVEYAQREMPTDFRANTFLMQAGERLGLPYAHLPIVERRSPPMEDGARLYLAYSPKGCPTLTGNPEGLRYLCGLCATLAEATPPHEHVHLYENEKPLFGNSLPLTLYNEPDEWLDKYAATTEDTHRSDAEADQELLSREIDPTAIAALGFFGELPPSYLGLRQSKLYRVLTCIPYSGTNNDVPAKPLRDKDIRRMYTFTVRNEMTDPIDFALDLDDPEIEFFTANDLVQVMDRG